LLGLIRCLWQPVCKYVVRRWSSAVVSPTAACSMGATGSLSASALDERKTLAGKPPVAPGPSRALRPIAPIVVLIAFVLTVSTAVLAQPTDHPTTRADLPAASATLADAGATLPDRRAAALVLMADPHDAIARSALLDALASGKADPQGRRAVLEAVAASPVPTAWSLRKTCENEVM